MTTVRHRKLTTRLSGFSLLETTIGLAVMGIGLIMVAAIFPVALTQHRDSIDQARAMDMIPQAEATIRNRVRPDYLFYSNARLAEGYDSPWYVMPMCNLDAGGGWSFNYPDPVNPDPSVDPMLLYANALNVDFSDPSIVPFSILRFGPTDILSDRIAPLNDDEANEASNRLAWYGFYRQLGNGGQSYAVAICKQRRNQVFLEQDLSRPRSLINPRPVDPMMRPNQRLPLPWRVTLALGGARGELMINAAPPLPAGCYSLAELAPVGSKIMIRGVPDGLPITTPVPAGRVLTVTETFPIGSVLVREDISDIVSTFDVWVFPPAAEGLRLTEECPILEWKESL